MEHCDNPISPRNLTVRLDHLIRHRLWAQILFAMVLGIGVGLLLSPDGGAVVDESTAILIANWLSLPGQLFLALIQMVVIPLVLSSIVVGIVGSGNAVFLKQVGLRIAPYFITTTAIAAVIGAAVALWIEPGKYLDLASLRTVDMAVSSLSSGANPLEGKSIPDLIVEIIPSNPTNAILQRSMFQIVMLAIFLAVALVSLPTERARPLMELTTSLQEVSMKVVSWAMTIAPLAVFGLLAEVSVQIGIRAIIGMSVYVGTVLLGLLLLLGIYLTIVAVVARISPLQFMKVAWDVQLLAFSTSSSAAVMPLSMQTAEQRFGVNSSIARFIVPLGSTVNMDGTALYQVVAAIFLTQLFGIELTLASLTLLAVTTVGASIGAPSTPGVGIIILATIVENLGVPASGIALIIGVDRILDMSRTAVNVSGDLTACLVMNRWLDHESLLDPLTQDALQPANE